MLAASGKTKVNLGGVDSVNLHTQTIRAIAIELASLRLAQSGLKYASTFHCTQVVAAAITTNLNAGKLSYFDNVGSVEQLAQLLTTSIHDLKLAGLDSSSLNHDSIEAAAKADDLKTIFDSYLSELAARKLADYADCLSIATKRIKEGRDGLPEELILIAPLEIDFAPLETEFLECLKQHCEFVEPDTSSKTATGFTPSFQSAVGEVNEVQLVFQRAFDSLPDLALDQIEILHTDYSTYVRCSMNN